jgi:hypothetical protein
MTGPWWTSTISDPLGSIRILKKANCPTLSGKSKLTYHIGCTTDSKIFLRIHANDGGGFFSQEWVAWKEIQQVLSKVPKDKSVNTPAFLLVVLKHEKLIQTVKGKKRSHELTDPKAFLARMDKLMASSATSKATGTARKTAKKARATAINRVFQQNWN